MKKISVLLACLVCLFGCQTEVIKENVVCGIDCEPVDMSSYEGFDNKDGVFLNTKFEDVITKIKNKDTFTLYLGFDQCPWCLESLPVLNQVALEEEVSINYVDVRPEGEDLRTEENESYVELQNFLSSYLDEEDNKIYVPALIVVDNGMIAGYHTGTMPTHDSTQRLMNETEKKQLEDIYEDLIDKVY